LKEVSARQKKKKNLKKKKGVDDEEEGNKRRGFILETREPEHGSERKERERQRHIDQLDLGSLSPSYMIYISYPGTVPGYDTIISGHKARISLQ
jgi:hypothetical protein